MSPTEAAAPVMLVDTGFAAGDTRAGIASRPPRHVLGLRLDPVSPARRQVEQLGFEPADVRDVVLTHLDLDHAGGLPDFPRARVHVFEPELVENARGRDPGRSS